ncbi:MAG: GPR endopeptidase [Erysipelotrichia bacterium]|nr:GPR endopeptidase [Erysipelotrichia bacterium]
MNDEGLQLRTDFCDELIVKEHHDDTISCVIKEACECKVVHVQVKTADNILQKAIGDYVTIEYEKMHDAKKRANIAGIVIEEMQLLMEKINKEIKRILIIGLGNRYVVSDALGPKCSDQILVTSHLYADKKYELLEGTRNVAVISPGVMGQTGLESADVVASVSSLFQPDLVIAIDALATSCTSRINHAIQINDIGIKPGSGVGNHRSELSEKTLHVPVIAIGVATVTSIGTILKETLQKLDKVALMHEMKDTMDIDLVVTPKNMDDDLTCLVAIISDALNHVIHPNYDQL